MVLDRYCILGTVVNGFNFFYYLPSNYILNNGVPSKMENYDRFTVWFFTSQLGELDVVLAEFIYSNKVK